MKLTSIMAVVVVSGSALAGIPKNRLVIATDSEFRAFDPRYTVDANSQYLEQLLHCSLVEADIEGKTVPSLAETLTWKDPKTLEVKLKSVAKFSDGTPVTGKDVAATYRFFLKEKIDPPTPKAAGAFKLISSVEVTPNGVTFHLKEPDASFITNLVVGVLPEKIAEGPMLTAETQKIGCGAFSLGSVELKNVLLTRNPHYGLGPKPKLEEVVFKVVADETTRYAKLLGGEVDVVQNGISLEKLEALGKNPKFKIAKHPGLKTAYVGMNFQDPTLQNSKVREAIQKVINPEAIIQHILKGYAQPARTLLLPKDVYFDTSLPVQKPNLEDAKKLLDAAGFPAKGPDGVRFTLSYKTSQDATRIAIAKAVAGDLGRIGIQVQVQSLEWGKFTSDIEKGHVQLWGLAWIGFKDPDIYRYAFASESFTPNGGNRGRFSTPKLDALLQEGRTTVDEKKRKEIYLKVQKEVATERPYIFLFHEDNIAIMSSAVSGYEVYADGRYVSLRTASKI